MIKNKPTDELNEMLENIKPDQLDSYYKNNEKYMAGDDNAFYYYMKDVLHEKRIKLKDVYSFAGITEYYGGKLIRMEKHTTNRDTILILCIAGHFSLIETNRALKLYGISELYAKDPRDACLIVVINNRIYDISKIDEILEEHGFARLSRDI